MHPQKTLPPRLLSLVALLVAAAASGGCGQKKITECNAMVQVINSGMASIEKVPKNEADPSGVSSLRALAEALDKVAADAGAVQITLPELKKMRDEYQRIAKDIAKGERELATAAQERDKTRRDAAEAALDAVVKEENPLVEQINKYCQAP
jgi:DNA repair ATPase RecN